jgi:U6 snRNA-associated Sm-like protein LSm8
MASSLESYVNEIVSVITNDGRHIVGILKGYDTSINLILSESHERVYSHDSAVQQILLGIYIVRGDNVAIVGQIDEDKDLQLDMNKIRGQQLKPVVH